MSSYGSEHDESEYEDATDYFNDECDDFSQQNVEPEDGYKDHWYWNGEMDDAFWEAQDMCFEEESADNQDFNVSDGDNSPRFELDFYDDFDDEDDTASSEQPSNQSIFSSHDKSSNSYEDFSEMCKKWQDILAGFKSVRVPKRSVKSTKAKVSSKIPKSPASAPLIKAPASAPLIKAPISTPLVKAPISAPLVKAPISSKIPKSTASAPLVKAPISVPLVIASISQLPISSPVVIAPISVPQVIAPISYTLPSLEISVTLTVDSSDISTPPTDDDSLHTTPGNFDLATCLEPSIIIINSPSTVDAESKVDEAIPELVVPVDACKKEEAPLDPIAPRTSQYSSLFSIIPTMQMLKRLFHTCTLHKFELGRDPPNVLDIGDSRFGFG